MTRKNLFKAGCLALVLALMLAAPVFAAFLTFVEFQQDGVGGVDGLDTARSVTASPDGKHLYAAGNGDDAAAVFSRDATTGKLTFVEFQQDGVGGVDGLDMASSVTASPDGKHVYAAGQNDDAMAVFSVPFAPIGGYTEPVSLLALSWSWIALAAAVGLGSIGMAAALRKRTAGR